MKVARFFLVVVVIFIIALVVYLVTTPSAKQIQFTGVVMGNDYMASALVEGRLQHVYVQEGSTVKKGEVVAEIDPTIFKRLGTRPLPTCAPPARGYSKPMRLSKWMSKRRLRLFSKPKRR
ncbi:MAG: biotin/lipoyl-binding protein [Terriglobia bacterium]